VSDLQSQLPLYQQQLNWQELWAAYPVPDVFARTVFVASRDEIRALQNRRFLETVTRGWANPFYRERWSDAGLQPGDIRGLDDIAELPTYNSDDVKADQQNFGPYGRLHDIHAGDLARTPTKVHTSGGTTGKPRAIMFSPQEWEVQAISSARCLYLQGGRPGDVMQIPVTCSLANLGWGIYKACHDYLGILPLTTGAGTVTSSLRQLQLAFEYGTNIWISFPEYLTVLAKVCRDELKRDIRELNTKFISTFLGPDTEGLLRAQLETLYGCPVYDQYGANEIGGGASECTAKSGLHVMEDMMYLEIVDTETGQPVADGEVGNIVATVFFRNMPPVIRYNLRDLNRVVSTARCACGGCFKRMDHFLGRSDDMVKIRGVNIYPMACLSAVKSDPRTTGEWICVTQRSAADGVIRDDFTVRVEVRSSARGVEGLEEHLGQRLKNDLGIKVRVELVAEGSLAPLTGVGREGKAKRLLDLRDKTRP
jgi:phenylacetate-CoA ligase